MLADGEIMGKPMQHDNGQTHKRLANVFMPFAEAIGHGYVTAKAKPARGGLSGGGMRGGVLAARTGHAWRWLILRRANPALGDLDGSLNDHELLDLLAGYRFRPIVALDNFLNGNFLLVRREHS